MQSSDYSDYYYGSSSGTEIAAVLTVIGIMLLYLVIIAAWIFLSYIISKKFEKIAFDKGYDVSIHSFAMCFWLGIIGYLYVIALPIKIAGKSQAQDGDILATLERYKGLLDAGVITEEEFSAKKAEILGI